MNTKVHVFAGKFASREDACSYSEEQWEPEPDAGVSDEQFAAWEARNPTWAMEADLDAHLDPDFIETIDGEDRYAYLQGLLVDKNAIAAIEQRAPDAANILVLIFEQALGGFPAVMRSTARLTYCGEHACTL